MEIISLSCINDEYRSLKSMVNNCLSDIVNKHIQRANCVACFMSAAFDNDPAADIRMHLDEILKDNGEWPSYLGKVDKAHYIELPRGEWEMFGAFPILKCRTELLLRYLEQYYNMDEEGKRISEKVLEMIDSFVAEYSEYLDPDKRIHYWYKLENMTDSMRADELIREYEKRFERYKADSATFNHAVTMKVIHYREDACETSARGLCVIYEKYPELFEIDYHSELEHEFMEKIFQDIKKFG